ncbi:hypothetical protein ACOMHN_036828 [Nucella lapillus]
MSRDAIALVKENILQAVDSIPVNLKEGGLFTIADYGAADGFASMPLIKALIEVVRKKHGEIPVQVVYEDQASNDFNSLFRLVHGVIPDPYQYFSKFRDVYVMATGTSFYQQILPANSAHIIMSFMSAHYSSKPAVKFQNSLERFPAATEAEAQLVAAQAARDWGTFLLHRAKELKAGGVLIVSMSAEDPGRKLQGVRHTTEDYIEAMLKVWRQMRDEGKITQEEFVDTNFYRCMYSSEELKAPFEDPESKVSKAGLKLFHTELVLVPCVQKKMWKEKLDEEGTDDRFTWAKSVNNGHKYWSIHPFIRALATTRSQREREALVNEMYQQIEKEILIQGPRKFKNDVLINYAFVRKI